MYLLALVCPPLAVLATGRIFQAGLNVLFSLLFYFPGALHAILVVADSKADRRVDRIADRAARTQVAVGVTTNVLVVVAQPITPASPIVAEAIRERQLAAERYGRRLDEERRRAARVRRNGVVLAIAEAPQRTARAAAEAYRELPDWAQPVTWGLAVGTPCSIIGVVLFLMKASGK